MNNYHINEEIAKGTNCVIYKARKKKSIMYFAIKSLDKCRRAKLMNEVKMQAALDHTNIVKFYNWHETTNHLWAIYEYSPGGNLHNLIKQDKRLTEDSIKPFLKDLILGLHYMHSKGVIYCDLKPSNILLNEFGTIKYCDFGLARHSASLQSTTPESSKGSSSSSNITGSKKGTPCYMAPELFEDEGVFSRQSDFWSLGCVLHEMATGSPPFTSTSLSELIRFIVSSTHTSDFLVDSQTPNHANASKHSSKSSTSSGFSPEFLSLLRSLLDKNATRRPTWNELISNPFFDWTPIQTRFLMSVSMPPQPHFDRWAAQKYPQMQQQPILTREVELRLTDNTSSSQSKRINKPINVLRLSLNAKKNAEKAATAAAQEENDDDSSITNATILPSSTSRKIILPSNARSKYANEPVNTNTGTSNKSNKNNKDKSNKCDFKLDNLNQIIDIGGGAAAEEDEQADASQSSSDEEQEKRNKSKEQKTMNPVTKVTQIQLVPSLNILNPNFTITPSSTNLNSTTTTTPTTTLNNNNNSTLNSTLATTITLTNPSDRDRRTHSSSSSLSPNNHNHRKHNQPQNPHTNVNTPNSKHTHTTKPVVGSSSSTSTTPSRSPPPAPPQTPQNNINLTTTPATGSTHHINNKEFDSNKNTAIPQQLAIQVNKITPNEDSNKGMLTSQRKNNHIEGNSNINKMSKIQVKCSPSPLQNDNLTKLPQYNSHSKKDMIITSPQQQQHPTAILKTPLSGEAGLKNTSNIYNISNGINTHTNNNINNNCRSPQQQLILQHAFNSKLTTTTANNNNNNNNQSYYNQNINAPFLSRTPSTNSIVVVAMPSSQKSPAQPKQQQPQSSTSSPCSSQQQQQQSQKQQLPSSSSRRHSSSKSPSSNPYGLSQSPASNPYGLQLNKSPSSNAILIQHSHKPLNVVIQNNKHQIVSQYQQYQLNSQSKSPIRHQQSASCFSPANSVLQSPSVVVVSPILLHQQQSSFMMMNTNNNNNNISATAAARIPSPNGVSSDEYDAQFPPQIQSQLEDIEKLLIHASDTQVKPIIGNKDIEKVQQEEVEEKFSREFLPFRALPLEDVDRWNGEGDEIEVLFSDIFAYLKQFLQVFQQQQSQQYHSQSQQQQHVISQCVNVLTYFERIVSNANSANRLINSAFMNLLVEILLLGLNSHSTIRLRITTIIGLLLRYANTIDPQFAALNLPTILIQVFYSESSEKIKRKLIAALGEYVFFASTQIDDDSSNKLQNCWRVSPNVLQFLTSSLITSPPPPTSICADSDYELIQFYATKAIENITSQSPAITPKNSEKINLQNNSSSYTSIGHFFSSEETISALAKLITNNNLRIEFQTSALIALTHIQRLSNSDCITAFIIKSLGGIQAIFQSLNSHNAHMTSTITRWNRYQQALLTLINAHLFSIIKAPSTIHKNIIIQPIDDSSINSIISLIESSPHAITRGKSILCLCLLLASPSMLGYVRHIANHTKFFAIIEKITRDNFKYVSQCFIVLKDLLANILTQILAAIIVNSSQQQQLPDSHMNYISPSIPLINVSPQTMYMNYFSNQSNHNSESTINSTPTNILHHRSKSAIPSTSAHPTQQVVPVTNHSLFEQNVQLIKVLIKYSNCSILKPILFTSPILAATLKAFNTVHSSSSSPASINVLTHHVTETPQQYFIHFYEVLLLDSQSIIDNTTFFAQQIIPSFMNLLEKSSISSSSSSNNNNHINRNKNQVSSNIDLQFSYLKLISDTTSILLINTTNSNTGISTTITTDERSRIRTYLHNEVFATTFMCKVLPQVLLSPPSTHNEPLRFLALKLLQILADDEPYLYMRILKQQQQLQPPSTLLQYNTHVRLTQQNSLLSILVSLFNENASLSIIKLIRRIVACEEISLSDLLQWNIPRTAAGMFSQFLSRSNDSCCSCEDLLDIFIIISQRIIRANPRSQSNIHMYEMQSQYQNQNFQFENAMIDQTIDALVAVVVQIYSSALLVHQDHSIAEKSTELILAVFDLHTRGCLRNPSISAIQLGKSESIYMLLNALVSHVTTQALSSVQLEALSYQNNNNNRSTHAQQNVNRIMRVLNSIGQSQIIVNAMQRETRIHIIAMLDNIALAAKVKDPIVLTIIKETANIFKGKQGISTQGIHY